MPRIQPVDPTAAKGKAKSLLDGVQKALGLVPNLYRVVAQSPPALEGLVGLNGALAQGVLGAKPRAESRLAWQSVTAATIACPRIRCLARARD